MQHRVDDFSHRQRHSAQAARSLVIWNMCCWPPMSSQRCVTFSTSNSGDRRTVISACPSTNAETGRIESDDWDWSRGGGSTVAARADAQEGMGRIRRGVVRSAADSESSTAQLSRPSSAASPHRASWSGSHRSAHTKVSGSRRSEILSNSKSGCNVSERQRRPRAAGGLPRGHHPSLRGHRRGVQPSPPRPGRRPAEPPGADAGDTADNRRHQK